MSETERRRRLAEAHRAHAPVCDRECGGKPGSWCGWVLSAAGEPEPARATPAKRSWGGAYSAAAVREWLEEWRVSWKPIILRRFAEDADATRWCNVIFARHLLHDGEEMVKTHEWCGAFRPDALPKAGSLPASAAREFVRRHVGDEFLTGLTFGSFRDAYRFAANAHEAAKALGCGMHVARRGNSVLLWKEG